MTYNFNDEKLNFVSGWFEGQVEERDALLILVTKVHFCVHYSLKCIVKPSVSWYHFDVSYPPSYISLDSGFCRFVEEMPLLLFWGSFLFMTLLSMYYKQCDEFKCWLWLFFFVGAFSVVVQRLKTVLFGLSVWQNLSRNASLPPLLFSSPPSPKVINQTNEI